MKNQTGLPKARLHLAESRFDKAIAARFATALERLGHVVSWDSKFLTPGVEWRRASRESLATADGLIVILSTNSVHEKSGRISSPWIAADIGAARATGKFVIPVLLDDRAPLPDLVDDLFIIHATGRRGFKSTIDQISAAITQHLDQRAKEHLLGLPVGYQHLAPGIVRFNEDSPFDQSVFVMMKFPDRTRMDGKQCQLLEEIWGTLEKELARHGLTARRADKRTYQDQLWDNLCVYMLGSRYGIAILEDRVANELNPNVALEYGFMKAVGRQVALFRDVGFKHDRADLTGKLSKPFRINKSGTLQESSLTSAVREWLLDLRITPKRRR